MQNVWTRSKSMEGLPLRMSRRCRFCNRLVPKGKGCQIADAQKSFVCYEHYRDPDFVHVLDEILEDNEWLLRLEGAAQWN
jgi:hypothetical protein